MASLVSDHLSTLLPNELLDFDNTFETHETFFPAFQIRTCSSFYHQVLVTPNIAVRWNKVIEFILQKPGTDLVENCAGGNTQCIQRRAPKPHGIQQASLYTKIIVI